MEYVRCHLKRYRDFICHEVEHRKQSYFRSLDSCHLDGAASAEPGGGAEPGGPAQGPAAAGPAPHPLHQQQPAQLGSSASAGRYGRQPSSSRFAAAAAQAVAEAGQAAGPVPPATVVVKAGGGALPLPGADLACALAAVEEGGAQGSPGAPELEPRQAPAPGARSPPKHTAFSAVQHLLAAAACGGRTARVACDDEEQQQQAGPQAAAAPEEAPPARQLAPLAVPTKQQRLSSTPGSPRSMVALCASMETDGSASGVVGSEAAEAAELAPLQEGQEEAPQSSGAAGAGCSSPGGGSGGSLLQRVPQLLQQMEGLLAQPAAGAAACPPEGDQQARDGRRAAVHNCAGELDGSLRQSPQAALAGLQAALPAPAFHSAP